MIQSIPMKKLIVMLNCMLLSACEDSSSELRFETNTFRFTIKNVRSDIDVIAYKLTILDRTTMEKKTFFIGKSTRVQPVDSEAEFVEINKRWVVGYIKHSRSVIVFFEFDLVDCIAYTGYGDVPWTNGQALKHYFKCPVIQTNFSDAITIHRYNLELLTE